MIRKLAFALSVLGACFTGFVHALGLGEAEVKSSLNQPLKAEISLVNVKGFTKDEVLPGLATREEFLRAGVDRVYFLSDMNFQVEDRNGELVVVLTTKKPVREPFLNFLVEVIWPSGRLLREYALLIDPPVFTKQKAQPVNTVATRPTETVTGDVVAMPKPQSVAKVPASRIEAGGSYGPTTKTDTLWDIALKARPNRSVSPQQVMLAIQDLNPNAFIGDNINKMKAGQVLRLPTLDQIRSRSSYDAINEVIAQNEALKPARKKAMVSSSKVDVPRRAGAAPSSASDELKLVVADKASDPAGSANSGEAEQGSANAVATEELALTLEKLDKANSDNVELTGRLGDLEEQLDTLQRLLTLKNDQLASLQKQMQANELARIQGENQPEVAAEETSEQAPVSDAAQTEVAPVEDAESGKEPAVADSAPAQDEGSVEEKAVEKPAEEQAQAAAAKPEPKKAEPKKVQQESKSFVETIFSNPLYMALGVVAILLVVLVLWFVSRSNAQREQEFQESYHEEDDASEAFTSEESEYDFDEESSELEADDAEDYAADGFGESAEESVSQDEEEDAIAEADVYIAYGRLDQAATILEEAISKDPVRTDYRLKLLEVYKESGDSTAFNRQFSELEAIQDPDAIEKANAIRSELSEEEAEELDNEMLDTGSAGGVVDTDDSLAAEDAETEAEEDTGYDPIDYERVELENEAIDEEIEETVLDVDLDSDDLDVDLDIDLNVDEPELAEASVDDVEEAASADDALEIDTSALDEVLESEGEPAASEEVIDAQLDEALDAQLDEALDAELDEALDDVELSGELDGETEIALPDDLDLSEELEEALDVSVDESDVEETPAAESPAEEAADDAVVSDDILEEAVDALGDPDDFESELGEGEDFDFLEGTDEASTKLDLARAYIDMGDVEGAKDILEEVKTEGTSEQQAEAQDLLDSIDD